MERADTNAFLLKQSSSTNKNTSLWRSGSAGNIGSAFSAGLTNSFVKLSTLVAGKEKERIFTTLEEESYICGQKHANNNQDVITEETGDWQYLVIDPLGIRPREDAIYSKQIKKSTSNRYKEGSICEIDRKRVVGWTTWLRLKDGGGWLFDISPKDKKARLVEVEVATGSWSYECVVDDAHILLKPSLSGAWHDFLSNGEVVEVQERLRPVSAKCWFLRLADGRGWAIPVDGHGRQVLQEQSKW